MFPRSVGVRLLDDQSSRAPAFAEDSPDVGAAGRRQLISLQVSESLITSAATSMILQSGLSVRS